MCVLLEFASRPPSPPFILLSILLYGATWPGKKHSEILIKTDLGQKKESHYITNISLRFHPCSPPI